MKVSSNKLSDLVVYYTKLMLSNYSTHESRAMLFILFEHYLNIDKIEYAKNPEQRISESEMLKVHFAVKDLMMQKPIQYIIGETRFLDLRLFVTEDVLIPRPETEELVQFIIKSENVSNKKIAILDIGSGSGCIAISLKKLLNADVSAIDFSNEALVLAAKNASLNNTLVKFLQLDLLNEDQWGRLERYDLIVSNPPYVLESEKASMKKNVIDFEPPKALFVPDSDPLKFYKKIILLSQKHLCKNGRLYFEINEAFGKAVSDLLVAAEFQQVCIQKDINGKERFVLAIK